MRVATRIPNRIDSTVNPGIGLPVSWEVTREEATTDPVDVVVTILDEVIEFELY